MSTTYQHIRMSVVDASANVKVMYPETTGADVTVSRTNNTNIPSGVSNAQGLADALASSAFTNPISDSVTANTSTWSSNKINTGLTNISVYVASQEGGDGKLHFVNSAGVDTSLNFNRASGTATAAQVLTGYTFSNSSGIGLNGNMTNQGAKVVTIDPGETYTIPTGFHNGSGTVTANPNQNSTTYTYASGSTGATVDMGVNNIYRYVNATNVYNQGLADGATTHTGTITISSVYESGTGYDMGVNHTYRYIKTDGLASNGPDPADLASTLEASSWQAIAYHAYIGDLSSKFSTGATKTLTLNTYEGVSSQTLTMVLAGFNQGGTTGTVDFVCKDCMKETYVMNRGNYNYYGFADTSMRAYLNGRVFNSIPTSCSNYIIEKNVMTYGGSSYNSAYHSMNKIWLLTEKEVGLSSYANSAERSAQTTYPIFTNNTNRIKNLNGSANLWWLASPFSDNNNNFCNVNNNGTANNNNANNSNGVAFGFDVC